MRKYQRYHLFLCFPPVFTPWLLYSFMPSVSPSPTVSMLRVTRVSRYSFLLSLSMATVSRSSGDGFNTLPPHSTCKARSQTGQRVALLVLKCPAWKPYIVDGDDSTFPQQEKGLLVVAVVVHLVCIDEDEVEGFSLAARQKLIWSRGRKTEVLCPSDRLADQTRVGVENRSGFAPFKEPNAAVPKVFSAGWMRRSIFCSTPAWKERQRRTFKETGRKHSKALLENKKKTHCV